MEKIDAVNEVLAEIGDNTITNLDDTKDIDAQNYKALFDGQTGEIQAFYNWNFNRVIVELTPIVADGKAGYEYVYEMPSDRAGAVGLPKNLNTRGSNRFTWREGSYDTAGKILIEKRKIYSNYNPLWIQYSRVVDWEDLPDFMQHLIKVAFKERVLRRNAGSVPPSVERELDEAKHNARAQNRLTAGGKDLSSGRLINARLGGSYRNRGRSWG